MTSVGKFMHSPYVPITNSSTGQKFFLNLSASIVKHGRGYDIWEQKHIWHAIYFLYLVSVVLLI